jgi:small subunit ribosomal protein S4
MTKRISAKKKASRALSVNLWGRSNDTFLKKNYRPGQHGTVAKKETTYGIQLKAKQKLKKYYSNMSETQFKNIFLKAKKEKGNNVENFVGMLERRLDAVIYRANFVPTFYAARQVINHRHILVNGKSVNIASYMVKPGDVVEIKQSSRTIPLIAESLARMEREIPVYIDVRPSEFSVKYNAVPKLADIPYPVEMEANLVVEFYSR